MGHVDGNQDAATRLTRRAVLAGGGALGIGALMAARSHAFRPVAGQRPGDAGQLDLDHGAVAASEAGRVDQSHRAPPPNPWMAGQFILSVQMNIDPHTGAPLQWYSGTLDDGPSPYNTPSILAAADTYGVKLGFCVIGMMVRVFPDLLVSIHSAGHQILGHSMMHSPYAAAPLGAQIAPTLELIHSVIGERPTGVRAPGLTRGQAYMDCARAAGVYELQTSWITSDYKAPRISAEQIFGQHRRGLTSGGVELNHDGGDARPTRVAYDSMLAYSQSVGFRCVTPNELLANGQGVPLDGQSPPPIGRPDKGPEPRHVDTCNFDLYSALSGMVVNLDVTRAQRSRAVEVLAELDEAEPEPPH